MNARTPRPSATPSRAAVGPVSANSAASALIYRGPQANPLVHAGPPVHAPNAALLIDFDNVTMGIQKDLHAELKALLGSEIIRGKVAVQRAYADWRRYPAYIVPLAESSIDMIMAPAYGTSKKNATDIRLAVDAMELVFTRPEIGTFILLSGDSDFASLVTKLKEYGKYVIGVGIRESSSDLLVMNCDEYYSYNALAGLVRTGDDEPVRKWDPWELLTEAVGRMKRNGDVMRSDRLKQVMQEIDASFDEKNEGYAKFSKFVHDAAGRGLLTLTRLDNGQLEVDVGQGAAAPAASQPAARAERPERAERADRGERPERAERPERGERPERSERSEPPKAEARDDEAEGREERARRGRRGRGRGRDRDREDRPPRADRPAQLELTGDAAGAREERPRADAAPQRPKPEGRAPAAETEIGLAGERLTREEAFDLVRRAVAGATRGDEALRASAVRRAAFDLLGRDSESLSERNFTRILRDAHDANVIDLRRRGDDFEVARAAEAAPVSEQLARAAEPAAPAAPAAAPAPRVGMGPRGAVGRGRGGRTGALPPELLSIGIVAPAGGAVATPVAATVTAPVTTPVAPPPAAAAPEARTTATAEQPAPDARAPRGRGRNAAKGGASKRAPAANEAKGGARKGAAAKKPAAAAAAPPAVAAESPAAKRGAKTAAKQGKPAAKGGRGPAKGGRAAKKAAPAAAEE